MDTKEEQAKIEAKRERLRDLSKSEEWAILKEIIKEKILCYNSLSSMDLSKLNNSEAGEKVKVMEKVVEILANLIDEIEGNNNLEPNPISEFFDEERPKHITFHD
jgi:hypothetical protein